MNSIFNLTIKRPFLVFVILGFLISLVTFLILDSWIPIWAALYKKPDLGYHNLPPIIHYIQFALRWVTWLTIALIFAMDLRKRNFVRTGGYSVGLLLSFVTEFIIFIIGYSITMSDFD